MMEAYQCSMNPKGYFTDVMNLVDNLGVIFVMLAPSNYIKDLMYCKNAFDTQKDYPSTIASDLVNSNVLNICIDGVPGK